MTKKVAPGQRRHSAPPGYITSTEATKKLGKMLYKHVAAGRIRKITPDGYKHGFYHAGDVESVLTTEQIFAPQYVKGTWRNHPSSTFERATEEDIPTIVDIDTRVFDEPAAPVEIQLSWFRKNPESFYVLRNEQGFMVGYASLIPLRQQVIDRFIRDELDSSEITPQDIPAYAPSEKFHLYVMALAVDPRYSPSEKHAYGARLVTGLFELLLSLADRGIEVETVTARSYKPDGLRLLRKMGVPQLRSPVPGKALFIVKVAESGFPWFVQYSDRLAEWRLAHQGATRGTGSCAPQETNKEKTT